MAERQDPIRTRYYRPLELAEAWGAFFFYAAAILSLVVLIGELKVGSPKVHAALQIAFLVCTLIGFVLGVAIRLYFMPRAERKRREDFLSNSLGVALTHERTAGYYNNDETDPDRRLGLNVLENSLHSKDTAVEMCRSARLQIGLYAVLWIILLAIRALELEWIVVAAQALFSEQLLSRWFRLEWLRGEVERIHSGLLRAFQSGTQPATLRSVVLEELIAYEAAKARAAVTLSSRVFERRNREVSREWERIKATLPREQQA